MININDLVATRTVVIYFPNGETEYWLTEREFSVGQTIERNGRVWIITDVAGSGETGGKPRIRLAEAETATSLDREALNRVAWNVPIAREAPT